MRRATLLAACMAALMTLAACAPTPQTRSTGEALDDAAITARVKSELIRAPGLTAGDINVTTYRGVVQLSGFVNSEEQVKRAEEVARTAAGVRSVDNALRVAPNVPTK